MLKTVLSYTKQVMYVLTLNPFGLYRFDWVKFPLADFIKKISLSFTPQSSRMHRSSWVFGHENSPKSSIIISDDAKRRIDQALARFPRLPPVLGLL